MVIRSVGVLSCAKVMGAMYVFVGLIVGGIFAMLSILGGLAAGPRGNQGEPFALLFGVGAVIILPLVYGGMGFIGGIIMGAIYNLVAGTIGGLEIQLERSHMPEGRHEDHYERD
jgi:hypothetical protein